MKISSSVQLLFSVYHAARFLRSRHLIFILSRFDSSRRFCVPGRLEGLHALADALCVNLGAFAKSVYQMITSDTCSSSLLYSLRPKI